jgi:putative aldouronate transport system permease protein
MEPKYWPWIMLCVSIWKGAGYSAIIYMATISGIDTEFYEAAELDGATRLQQVWHITLPFLLPTVIILTIMSIGRIMNADFGLFFNVTRDIPSLYPTTDVLDTYIYRALRKSGDIGISSATGFFQSVVSFALVIVSNQIANRIREGSALFETRVK